MTTIVPAVAAVVLVLSIPATALAQATRTWVSGVGDDANPCSRTAPCKTWAGAISKTAIGGEIDALDPGGFGAVTITKSITLQAVGLTAGVLVAGTNGIVVSGNDSTIVTLRGLDFDGLAPSGNGGLNGVSVLHAATVRLESDEIYGFTQNGINFTPAAPAAGQPTPNLLIEDSIIHDNGQDGLLAIPPSGSSARVVISNSRFESNGCGIAGGLATATFTTAACGTAGMGTGTLNIDSANTSSSDNTGAGVSSNGSTVTNEISGDLIVGNGTGLQELNGGLIIAAGTNSVFGSTASDGSPTSTVATGNQGAVGPQGPAGPAGPAGASGKPGPAGDIELVTCKNVTVTVTKTVKGKKKKVKETVQKCTGKLVSGTVKFTATGTIVKGTLTKAGDVYATGDLRMDGSTTKGMLKLRRKLTRGRYTLTLTRGKTVVARRTITV